MTTERESGGPVPAAADAVTSLPAPARLPIVDRDRCEAKAACVLVCPTKVFGLRKLTADERSRLGLRGKLKAWVHGGRQAYLANPHACNLCGLCVSACPEGAIYLPGPAAESAPRVR